jgi:hypothetical protein
MPRYFFHMVDGVGSELIRDSDGVVLEGASEARKQAIALARHIVEDSSGESLDAWKIAVTDENGDELLIMPLSEMSAQSSRMWFQPGSLIARCKHLFGLRPSARFEAAAALGIVVQAALMTVLMIVSKGESYRTASPPAGDSYRTASAAADEQNVAVRFIPQASPEAISEFLDRYKAAETGSPRSGGFYRLRLSNPRLPKEELAKLVTRMMQESIVELAATVE